MCGAVGASTAERAGVGGGQAKDGFIKGVFPIYYSFFWLRFFAGRRQSNPRGRL